MPTSKQITIAIDGHSGSGKSATAKMIARKLHLKHIDTGAMYRAVTYELLKRGMDFHQEIRIKALLPTLCISFAFDSVKGENQTFCNGKNIESQIRSLAVSQAVSQVSALPFVREFLQKQQREMGKVGGVIAEGRDIGSRIFPNAELKIFMTADLEIRAQRRYQELKEQNVEVAIAEIYENLKARDSLDSSRPTDALRPCSDAIILDTSKYSLQEQCDWIIEKAKALSNEVFFNL